MENIIGGKFSSYLISVWHGKKTVDPSAVVTLDFMLLYMFLINSKHLPFTPVSSILYQSPPLQTISNACLKSTNAQYNFFLFVLAISTRLCIINKLSDVEKPLRKPTWHEFIISFSSKYELIIVWSMDVNSLPKPVVCFLADEYCLYFCR